MNRAGDDTQHYNLGDFLVYVKQPKNQVYVSYRSQFFKLVPVDGVKYSPHKKRLLRYVRRQRAMSLIDFMEYLRIYDEFGGSIPWARLVNYKMKRVIEYSEEGAI